MRWASNPGASICSLLEWPACAICGATDRAAATHFLKTRMN
jgi:hypothetical protein